MLLYVPERRPPSAARTWLLLIFLFPWPGLVLYLFVGRIHLPARRRALLEEMSGRIREAAHTLPVAIRTPLAELPHDVADAAELAENLTAFPMLGGNSVELLGDYEGSLNRLAADLDVATTRIHLLYYIYADDEVASRVTEALERAARRGVKCRLLLDGIGAKPALKKLAPRLRREGIEVTELLPVRFFRPRRPRLDVRNHRKLAIIDGTVGYVGSQNIVAPRFVPGFPNEELVARVTGPVVAEFEAVFLEDRVLELGAGTGIRPHLEGMARTGPVFAQLVPSSPGYRQQTFATLLLSLIHQARHRITITTPYCVPDEPFLAALRTAVARGVEVRLIVPRHSNQRLTVLAQNSFFAELLEAGVRIYRYRPHFLHAKSIAIDDEVVIVGSSNMDIRSFALNAEANLLLHDANVASQLRAINERHLANSDPLTLAEWNKRSFWVRVAQNTARLADSFL
ncbi:MAG TPA: cardiolipin synthase [Verrucomicrobiales bacterium]|nr:cardiolipin synthase [Verrucomicrobiales bacterium]